MPHTTIVKDDQGRAWSIVHNGDWSGDADIFLNEDDDTPGVTIPASVIKAACREVVLREVMSLIESAFEKSR